MFGMFQRRDQRLTAQRGDYLASFIRMNRGGIGLSAREKLAVARRIETAPPLDNPLSALAISTPVGTGAPLAAAPVVVPPVGTQAAQPGAQQSVAAGGAAW